MCKVCYRIAGQLLELHLPAGSDPDGLLPSFISFRCDSQPDEQAVCVVCVVRNPVLVDLKSVKVLSTYTGMLGRFFSIMESPRKYIFDMQMTENGSWYRMVSDKQFVCSQVFISLYDLYTGRALSSFLMVAFAQAAVMHHTFLMHASVVVKDAKGYAFLGKSGTGKSTHSALWQRSFEQVSLLNDDNPAVRIEDNGDVFVYGTPWSGKTPCYKNEKAQLKGLIRLEQASYNCFTQKKGIEALLVVLPGCCSMRWNDLLYKTLCDLLELVIQRVPVAHLHCLPDEEAARLCFHEIINVKIDEL